MATEDYGVDVHCVDDFLPDMPTVTGKVAIAQAAARRLQTQRGIFPWWTEYGRDLRGYLLSSADTDEIASDTQAEVEKDERVDRAGATALLTGAFLTVSVPIEPDDETDPFEFVFTVTADAVSLLIS